MPKATHATFVRRFTDIPNVGPAMERDFLALGLRTPQELIGLDPYQLYLDMCKHSGTRQDPCVLDTYLAVCEFMNGGPTRPWWEFTKVRKERLPDL